MNDTQARELVLNALADVAPEIDTATFDPDTSLRDGRAGFDGLPRVRLRVSEVLDIDVPEDDYRLDTVNSAVAYVVEKAGA